MSVVKSIGIVDFGLVSAVNAADATDVGSGTPNGEKFLRDDLSWQYPVAIGTTIAGGSDNMILLDEGGVIAENPLLQFDGSTFSVGNIAAMHLEIDNEGNVQTGDCSTVNSQNSSILINRVVSDAALTSRHGLADNTTLSAADNTVGMNSFDAYPIIGSGIASMDHYQAFQARPAFAHTGTVGTYGGFYSAPVFNTGVVSSIIHHTVVDASGTGSGGTQVGFDCPALVFATNNFGFRSVADCFFQDVGCGAAPGTDRLRVYGATPIARVEGSTTTAIAIRGTTNSTDRWDIYTAAADDKFRIKIGSTDTIWLAAGQMGVGITPASGCVGHFYAAQPELRIESSTTGVAQLGLKSNGTHRGLLGCKALESDWNLLDASGNKLWSVPQGGPFGVRQGTSTGLAKCGGAIFNSFADAGNTTTSETDLVSNITVASALGTNGDKFEALYAGITVAHASDTRRFRVYFGGTLIFDSTAIATVAAANWEIRAIVIRESSTVVRCSVSMVDLNNLAFAKCNYTRITGLTLSGTNILKITGTSSNATNDIVLKFSNVNWKSAA